VRRDRALDTYERVLQQHIDQLAAKTMAENRALEEEIARRAAELRARIEENSRALAVEQGEFQAWKARKDLEEALIAEAVGHFVSENPVSTRPQDAAAKGGSDVR
jgi:DNA repair ATPase RecN